MANSVAEAFVTLRPDVSKFKGDTESALGGIAGTLGKAAIGALAAVGGAVAFAGVRFDDMRQQSELAFTTMLGSSSKATALLDKLQDFAAKTPFQFKDLILQTQRLMAMGIAADDVIPTLTSLGDAVAGLAGGSEGIARATTAIGQMAAAGKVTAQDMRQLTELGIPAWRYLAEAIGTDTAGAMEAVSKRSVDASTGIAALTKGMDRDFGGLMAKQSLTFGGLMSTMSDTFQIVSGRVMQPFFKEMTSGLKGIADFMGTPAFSEGLTTFMGLIGAVFGVIKDIVLVVTGFDPAAGGALKNLFGPEAAGALMGAFAGIREGVKTLLKGIGDLFAFLGSDNPLAVFIRTVAGALVLGALTLLGEAFKIIGEALSFLTSNNPAAEVLRTIIAGVAIAIGTLWTIGMIAALPGAFMALIGPITGLIAIMGGPLTLILIAVAAAVYLVVTHWGDITKVFNESVAGWGAIFDALGTTVRGWVDAVTTFFGDVRDFVGGAFDAMGTTIRGWVDAIGSVIRGFVDSALAIWKMFTENPPRLIGIMVGLVIGSLLNLAQGIGDFVGNTARAFGDWVGNVGKTVGDFFTALPGRMGSWLSQTGGNIGSFHADTGTKWSGWITNTSSTIGNFFSELPSRMGAWLGTTAVQIEGFKEQAVAAIKVFIADTGETIGTFFDNLPARMLNYGVDMVRGFLDGMGSMKTAAWNSVMDFFKGIIDGVKAALGIHSPSTVMAGIGYQIVAGLQAGIADNGPVVINALNGLIGTLMSNADAALAVAKNKLAEISNTEMVRLAGLQPGTGMGGAYEGLNRFEPGVGGKAILAPNDPDAARLAALYPWLYKLPTTTGFGLTQPYAPATVTRGVNAAGQWGTWTQQGGVTTFVIDGKVDVTSSDGSVAAMQLATMQQVADTAMADMLDQTRREILGGVA